MNTADLGLKRVNELIQMGNDVSIDESAHAGLRSGFRWLKRP